MDYLRKKYAGYQTVSTESLKDELLLSPGEYLLVKKEVAELLGRRECPAEINYDLFDSLVELHL